MSYEAACCSLQPLVSEAGRKKGAVGKMFLSKACRGSGRYTAVHICMASDPDERRFLFIDWGKPRGKSEVSAGVSLGLSTRIFTKANVRQIFKPPMEYAGRLGAVRLVRGDLDLFCDRCLCMAGALMRQGAGAQSAYMALFGQCAWKGATSLTPVIAIGCEWTYWPISSSTVTMAHDLK